MTIKYFFRSALVFVFCALFMVFSCFADSLTLSYEQIKSNLSISSFRYTVLNTDTSGQPTSSLGSFYGNSNGSQYVGTFGNIVCAHNILTYSSVPTVLNKPSILLNIPFYLYNVSSLDFDFFFTFCSFNGTSGNIKNCYTSPADQYANLWDFDSSLEVCDKNNRRFSVAGAVVYRGVAYFTVPGAPGTNNRLPFLKFTIHVDIPRSADYSVKWLRLASNEMPYQQIFDGSNQKFVSVLGLQPDNPYIVTSNPQLGVIQGDLDEISFQLDDNLEKLDDIVSGIDALNVNIEEQTDRILYEVSPENQVIINSSNQRLAEVKNETAQMVSGLDTSDFTDMVDEYKENNGGTLGNFDSLVSDLDPELLDDSKQELKKSFDKLYNNLPLEAMLIIVLTLTLTSFVLFGKKG